MITVSKTVSEIVQSDELAQESLRAGLLNLSAYAAKIHGRVENVTYKKVKTGTIVVALSRIAKTLTKVPPLAPEVKIENLSVRSGLSTITFEKTPDIERKIAVLHPFSLPSHDLFAVIEGPTEISVISSDRARDFILKHFATKSKYAVSNLVALTVYLSREFSKTPNSYFALLSPMAAKRIEIFQIISTPTEVSFIIKKADLEQATSALNFYFAREKK